MFNWLKRRRRKKILDQAWPARWSDYLRRNLRQYREFEDKIADGKLDAALLNKLHDAAKIIVAEKNWTGSDGLVITSEIKVTIAAQAAVMLLGVEDYYFDEVRSIVVAPDPIVRQMQNGVVVYEQEYFAGLASESGLVVLSWHDVLAGSRSSHDGFNLVIHEFAHCLDGIDGQMAGDLVFADRETTERWQQVCDREFQALQAAVAQGRRTLLDPYGASNRAEFFAVASEAFFERSHRMKATHPELFGLLVKYYRIDPTLW